MKPPAQASPQVASLNTWTDNKKFGHSKNF